MPVGQYPSESLVKDESLLIVTKGDHRPRVDITLQIKHAGRGRVFKINTSEIYV
jgi:hypothetical protein